MKTALNWRTGLGYDLHCLEPGRKLFLGGVEVPYSRGLKGHSDADVVLHAICDALLGAAGLGDIGEHFPPGNLTYKNISSLLLLKNSADLIFQKNFSVVNIDVVVLAEQPKISPYKEEMKQKISRVLGIDKQAVNIKATTTEGTGVIGKKEAIAAYAVVLLELK
ncbi:MAG: 2-C-methyl-D-erythritol 2,4-cyclodiphosphate synthase [Candidatus Omnitrophota bacterium]